MSGRAFLGLSHTPLLGLNPIDSGVELELLGAIEAVRRQVSTFAPELVVLIAPDHYNGFFNELMPPFCIGSQARAVGDYTTPAGNLRVDESTALALADHLIGNDFDVAVSRRMVVDHGFAQALQLLWGSLDTPPVVPIFMNSIVKPVIPRLKRCHALGLSIGRFLDGEPRRTLVIGSGGLSHEPPVPTLQNPDPAVRERIMARHEATQAERDAKTLRVRAAGMALAAGDGAMKPLNPLWDRRWMDALSGSDSDLLELCAMDDAAIDGDAGLAAHESKSWLVARSALMAGEPRACTFRHYQAIPEYIAGFGILMLQQGQHLHG